MTRMAQALFLFFALLATGCTGFAPVRSGEVVPGRRLEVAVTASTPPGDETAWFWSFDCSLECDHPVAALSISGMYGVVPVEGPAFELGGGWSGTHPYVEGFVQLGDGGEPFGVGARVGVLRHDWSEDVLYAAYDVAAWRDGKIVGTTSILRHGGRTPNGATEGTVMALIQGMALTGGRIEPSVAGAVGRAERAGQGSTYRAYTVFIVLGARILVGGEKAGSERAGTPCAHRTRPEAVTP